VWRLVDQVTGQSFCFCTVRDVPESSLALYWIDPSCWRCRRLHSKRFGISIGGIWQSQLFFIAEEEKGDPQAEGSREHDLTETIVSIVKLEELLEEEGYEYHQTYRRPSGDMSIVDLGITQQGFGLLVLENNEYQLRLSAFSQSLVSSDQYQAVCGDPQQTSPFEGTVHRICFGSEEIAVVHSSFLTPKTCTLIQRGASSVLRQEAPSFSGEGLVTERFEARSRDGTIISYVVVRPDVANPVPIVLEVYGGFGRVMLPQYEAEIGVQWLERGGGYAVGSVRGGGEKGRAWHGDGMGVKKINAVDDTIAIAEDMLSRGLTTSGMLGLRGWSNGGLVVTNAALRSPTLFGGVVAESAILDLLASETMGCGAWWINEYGTTKNPAEREMLETLSFYHQINKQIPYPPLLLLCARGDERVTPEHSRRVIAKMRQQGMKHCYLYELHSNSHAGENVGNLKSAVMWAFFAHFLGDTMAERTI
jgi:prolyl oligopeptidase